MLYEWVCYLYPIEKWKQVKANNEYQKLVDIYVASTLPYTIFPIVESCKIKNGCFILFTMLDNVRFIGSETSYWEKQEEMSFSENYERNKSIFPVKNRLCITRNERTNSEHSNFCRVCTVKLKVKSFWMLRLLGLLRWKKRFARFIEFEGCTC